MHVHRIVFAIALMLGTLFGVVPTAAAKETVLNLHAIVDPMVPPDPSVCARAPFTPNVLAGGAIATYRTRASDGVVVQKDTRRVGRATACGLLTEIAPFVQGPLYLELTIDDDLLIALGTCTLASASTPAPGILTFACALNLTNPHGRIKGGFLVSSSALDLLDLGLVDTGSYWTLRLYEDD